MYDTTNLLYTGTQQTGRCAVIDRRFHDDSSRHSSNVMRSNATTHMRCSQRKQQPRQLETGASEERPSLVSGGQTRNVRICSWDLQPGERTHARRDTDTDTDTDTESNTHFQPKHSKHPSQPHHRRTFAFTQDAMELAPAPKMPDAAIPTSAF